MKKLTNNHFFKLGFLVGVMATLILLTCYIVLLSVIHQWSEIEEKKEEVYQQH